MNVSVLLLKVWNTLPGLPGCKVIQTITADLHCSTGIQIRNCSV